MNLAPGTRIQVGEQSSYRLGEWLPGYFRLPWRRGVKIFRNYRHVDRSLFEAAEDEGLAVLIRGPDPSAEQVRFELESVFSLPGAVWFPEPIDLIESEAGTLLVLADPHAISICERSPSDLAGFVDEATAMVRLLHRSGLIIGGVDLSDFAVDADGRLFFLGTDLVTRAESPAAIAEDLRCWLEFTRVDLG